MLLKINKFTVALECFDCDSIPTTGAERIKKDILCLTYDPNVSPKTMGTEVTELSVMVIIKAVQMVSKAVPNIVMSTCLMFQLHIVSLTTWKCLE